MSGHALSMFRRSALAHTMNAFIGRFMCSPPSDMPTPETTPPAPEVLFDLPFDDLTADLSNENPPRGATEPTTQHDLQLEMCTKRQ